MKEYDQYKQRKDEAFQKQYDELFQQRLVEAYRNLNKKASYPLKKRFQLARCKFEKDVYGFYLTPLLGYSNVGGQKSIWIGWLFWLFSIIWEEE